MKNIIQMILILLGFSLIYRVCGFEVLVLGGFAFTDYLLWQLVDTKKVDHSKDLYAVIDEWSNVPGTFISPRTKKRKNK